VAIQKPYVISAFPKMLKRARAGMGTLRWLCEAYCGSTEFAELGKSTGHV
jgi:hypothetical protein